MDDENDSIMIIIRLTKANYNRMWEIKVSYISLEVLMLHTLLVYRWRFTLIDHPNRCGTAGTSRVPSVFSKCDWKRADDEFRG